MTMNKNAHEEFARFFEKPTRESFRDLIKRNYGETNQLDFKEEWPADTKIARHILGLANSGGGCLVVGIAEAADGGIVAKGLGSLKDKADLQKGVQKYLPNFIGYTPLDFAYEDSEYPTLVGKKFQVVVVEDKPRYLPFVSFGAGEGIKVAAIYIRRGTSTEEANYYELQAILNRRIETDYSTQTEFNLEQELAELQLLFRQIERYRYVDPAEDAFQAQSLEDSGFYQEENSFYPAEDFEDFIANMIIAKKLRIKALLKLHAVGA